MVFLPLPVVCVLCVDDFLGFLALWATGMCVGMCAHLNLVLGLPTVDIDVVGLSAIRHFTIY